MKKRNFFFIIIVIGVIFTIKSCSEDDLVIDEPITENPEDPIPSDEEYTFKKTIQNTTQNPCGQMYCSIKQVFFLNEEVGYSVSGVDIYKTINGGESWNIIFNQDIAGELNLLSEELMFVNVYDGVVKTVNEFSSVSMIERPMAMMCSETGHLNVGTIQFVDDQNGFIRDNCYKGILYNTIDSGVSWSQVYESENIIDEYYFRNATDGFVLTNNHIYLTENQGQTWEEVPYLPNQYEHVLLMTDGFLFPGGENVTKPDFGGDEIIVKYYDFNSNGDIAIILYDEEVEENQWQLMLYVNAEEPKWIFIDQLPDIESLYSSVHLLDNKTIYVSQFYSGEIVKYELE